MNCDLAEALRGLLSCFTCLIVPQGGGPFYVASMSKDVKYNQSKSNHYKLVDKIHKRHDAVKF